MNRRGPDRHRGVRPDGSGRHSAGPSRGDAPDRAVQCDPASDCAESASLRHQAGSGDRVSPHSAIDCSCHSPLGSRSDEEVSEDTARLSEPGPRNSNLQQRRNTQYRPAARTHVSEVLLESDERTSLGGAPFRPGISFTGIVIAAPMVHSIRSELSLAR